MGLIYKISNDINDKVYIGQTKQELSRRWSSHCKDSKTKDTYLYRAMRKYGIDHFFIEAIELNIDNDQLDEREIYWIQFYDSYNNGYNLTPGGHCVTFETIPVYQYSMEGDFIQKYESAAEAERQTRCLHQNILKVCKGILRYCNNYIWSFEKFDKIQMRQNRCYKQVNQYDSEHNYLCTYDTVKAAAESIGVVPTNISRACRKHYRCHGYYWEYV